MGRPAFALPWWFGPYAISVCSAAGPTVSVESTLPNLSNAVTAMTPSATKPLGSGASAMPAGTLYATGKVMVRPSGSTSCSTRLSIMYVKDVVTGPEGELAVTVATFAQRRLSPVS